MSEEFSPFIPNNRQPTMPHRSAHPSIKQPQQAAAQQSEQHNVQPHDEPDLKPGVMTNPDRVTIDISDEDTMETQGIMEASPAQVAAKATLSKTRIFANKATLFDKVIISYSCIFDRQIAATSGRDKGKNNNELRLAGVRLKIDSVETFKQLEVLHNKHGRDSLKFARAMLHKELEVAETGLKLFTAAAERKVFQRVLINPKKTKAERIDADVQFCENQIEDLKELGARS